MSEVQLFLFFSFRQVSFTQATWFINTGGRDYDLLDPDLKQSLSNRRCWEFVFSLVHSLSTC